jgi:hypothetical protein
MLAFDSGWVSRGSWLQPPAHRIWTRRRINAKGPENRLRSWLSRTRNRAGMDGNRTHPGRLSSAPQTVLKTACLVSTTVHQYPLEFDRWLADSLVIRRRTRLSVMLAVSATEASFMSQVRGSTPCRVRYVLPGSLLLIATPQTRMMSAGISPCSTVYISRDVHRADGDSCARGQARE